MPTAAKNSAQFILPLRLLMRSATAYLKGRYGIDFPANLFGEHLFILCFKLFLFCSNVLERKVAETNNMATPDSESTSLLLGRLEKAAEIVMVSLYVFSLGVIIRLATY